MSSTAKHVDLVSLFCLSINAARLLSSANPSRAVHRAYIHLIRVDSQARRCNTVVTSLTPRVWRYEQWRGYTRL